MTHYDFPAYRGSSGKPGGSAWAWGLVALVVLLVVAGVAVSVYLKITAERLDPQTLCSSKGPSSVTVFLIDATDAISPVQELTVENRLTGILRSLKKNELLQVFEIRPGVNLLQPVFDKCRPVAPEEVSDITGNKRQAGERFNKEFSQQIHSTLEATLNRPAASSSPIMEAIQAASVRAFQSPDLQTDAKGFRRQLVVVSDMLENAEAGSHYRGVPEFDEYEKSAAYRHSTAKLSRVDATVLYILRRNAESIQTDKHETFWADWFNAQGATIVDWAPVAG